VIGMLARRESAKGHDVWIVSGDKDMTQLVGPHVKLYNLLKPRADARSSWTRRRWSRSSACRRTA
jgi:5'-3' exonuclease